MKAAMFVAKAVIVAAIIATATYLFGLMHVYSGLQSFLLDKVVAIGVEPGVASSGVTLVALAVTPLMLGAFIRIAFGNFLNGKVATSIALAIAAVGAYVAFTHDWLFDANGRSLAYVCPPNNVGGKPVVTWRAADTKLGVLCQPVTRENATAVAALRQGREATKIELRTVADVSALVTYRYGHPVVYVSRAGDLYDGPGWDDKSPELLRIVSAADLGARRAELQAAHDAGVAKKEAIKRAALKAEEEKQQAERVAIKAATDIAAAAQKAVEVQEARLRDDQERQSAAQRAAVERSARHQREQNEISRLAELEAQKRVAHRQFFNSDVYDDSVPLVVWASGRLPAMHVQVAIEAAVIKGHSGYYKATTAVRPAFWTTARPADVLNGDYSGLGRVAYPSGISKIVFIRFDGEDCDCGQMSYRVSIATFDVRRSTVAPSNQLVRA